jgi:hypothetical protein
MRVLVLSVAIAIASVTTLVPTASAVADSRTPGGAAYCGVTEGEPPVALICWTPNDGFTVAMRERGRATKQYNTSNVGFHDVVGRVLGFGQHWHIRGLGFWCSSHRTGLTCWNRVGHGWWLGRYRGYRIL